MRDLFVASIEYAVQLTKSEDVPVVDSFHCGALGF